MVAKLFRAIERKVLANDLGTSFFSPIDVYLNNKNVYQPDIAFVATARLDIIHWEKGIMDAPDLVVKILSNGNKKYDKVDKKKVYETCGVKEYWLVDYKTKWCKGFELVDGKFSSLGETSRRVHIKLLEYGVFILNYQLQIQINIFQRLKNFFFNKHSRRFNT